MTSYVLGFLFNESKSEVVLIQKAKPKWQEGLLNGVGGKIEADESSYEAMSREFKEETGVYIMPDDWFKYAIMQSSPEKRHVDTEDWSVHVFKCINEEAFKAAKTTEKEPIIKAQVERSGLQTVSNIPWLLQMALDDNYGNGFFATVRY